MSPSISHDYCPYRGLGLHGNDVDNFLRCSSDFRAGVPNRFVFPTYWELKATKKVTIHPGAIDSKFM